MTDKIVEPVAPENTDPMPLGPLSGDWHDDDAQVYDDDFIAADHGPLDPMGVPHASDKRKTTTRLLTAFAVVGAGSLVPVMLLPADPNRKSLTVIIISNVAAVKFLLGSDRSDVYNGSSIYATNFPIAFELPCHTGAVWAWCDAPVNAVSISVMAVTE